jgi:aspartate-semialdehyde dehydrogenase
MKNGSKTNVTTVEAGSWGGLFRVAIVGAATLKGREIKDVLNERNFPTHDVRLLDDDESLGQLEAIGDEPTFIQSVLPEHLESVDFVFFASDDKFTRNSWNMAKQAGSDIIDVSFGLEGVSGVELRAPWIERELGSIPSLDLVGAPVRVAHPAAMVLALLMLRLGKAARVAKSVVTILEPASERGKRGMDELHEQTVSLLSFQQLPKNIFDTQVAFNLIDRYGTKADPALQAVETRISQDFRQIVGGRAEVPSLMLLQAPIFHGHAFSLYIEFEQALSLAEVSAALSGDHVAIWHGEEDAPSNVSAAGQEQVQLMVRNDGGSDKGFWIWAASDNLRVAATAAVECAESLLPGRPRGTVQ